MKTIVMLLLLLNEVRQHLQTTEKSYRQLSQNDSYFNNAAQTR